MRISTLKRLLSVSRFFPSPSEYNHFLMERLRPVYDRTPKYPESLKKAHVWGSANIEKGMLLDANYVLNSLPLDMRVRVRNSKYLMVCCFLTPVLVGDFEAHGYIHNLVSVSSELRCLYGSDFEMILVAKMRERWSKRKASFNHFFSGFPSFCHVVPFSETEARDLLCKQLGLRSPVPQFVLLERFFHSSCCFYKVLQHCDISFFLYYGADWFPFHDENLQQKRNQLVHSCYLSFPSKFDEIFGRDSSKLQVFKPSSGGAGGRSTSLSELQGKVVGLFLCSDGSLIQKLDKVCRQCKERSLELEIVVVYMPFSIDGSSCKNQFIEFINEELCKVDASRSWWILPFTDSVSRRLFTICPDADDYGSQWDRLIVVGPHGEYVDPHAGAILREYEIDVYPFTRERLIEWELEKIRALNLESLLVYRDQDYVLGKGSNGSMIKVPVTQLRGRVIFFLFHKGNFAEIVLKYYAQLKSVHPSFEVVSMTSNLKTFPNVDVPDLPWLVCPINHDHSDFVAKMLRSDYPSLIAFGKNGRVSSYRVLDLLEYKGTFGWVFLVFK